MSLRITGGGMRGRRFSPPGLHGLRPTPAKVREALFSMLGDVRGWRVLDLYAGSGIIALEALSRGAAFAVSVERSRRAVAAMRRVADAFGVRERWRVMAQPVEKALAGALAGERFDLVFADPPYRTGAAAALPARLRDAGVDGEWLAIEEAADAASLLTAAENARAWEPWRQRVYGDTCLWLLRRKRAADRHG